MLIFFHAIITTIISLDNSAIDKIQLTCLFDPFPFLKTEFVSFKTLSGILSNASFAYAEPRTS